MLHAYQSKVSVDVPSSIAREVFQKIADLYQAEQEIDLLEIEGIITIHNIHLITSVEWKESKHVSPNNLGMSFHELTGQSISGTLRLTIGYIAKSTMEDPVAVVNTRKL